MHAINSLVGTILLWAIGLFILYVVISAAVKEGINRSIVGQHIEKSMELASIRNHF